MNLRDGSRVLLIRMDKLGDLVLSLPSDRSPALKNCKTSWWITKGSEFIPRHSAPGRSAWSWPRKIGLAEFFSSVRWLREHQIQVAIVLYAPWWVGLALWLARVPVRIGRQSQWHSFLFFNQGVRQSRSQSQMHELDYNLDLIDRGLGIQTEEQASAPAPQRHRPSSSRVWEMAKTKVPGLVLQPPGRGLPAPLKSGTYIVVHPGMAKSALNWPLQKYAELVRSLVALGEQVVITGTPMDRFILDPLKTELFDLKLVHWFSERLSSEELLDVLAGAKAVVAPSTGVLHFASALGQSCVGLYSPLTAHSPQRWGPLGPRARVLLPGMAANDSASEVMAQITVGDVLEQLRDLKAIDRGTEQGVR